MTESICTWSEDDDGNWNTSCSQEFILIEGTPSQNDMRFCCYCGCHLVEKLYEPEPEDE
jgi:hypothetical protein